MRLRDLHRDRAVWAFVVIILAMFYRPLATATFYFRDLYLLYYPKKLLFVDAIRSGRIPLWDPFTNGGQPFLVLPTNFSFHPSNVLYFVLPPLFAFNLVLVLHVLFCAIAAYWCARVARLSMPAAFVAGAIFAFCGYTLSTANLTPLLLGLPWIPMAIGLTHRALRDGRSLAPACFAAAMPLFGAAAELTAMLFATLAVWVLFTRASRITAVALIFVAAMGLALVVTLPTTSLLAQSTRGEGRSYESFSSWSVAPQRLPELLIPRFLGDPNSMRADAYWGRRVESGGYPYMLSLYLGIPALLLALVGALAVGSWRLAVEPDDGTANRQSPTAVSEVPRRSMAGVAAVALLLSLGQYLPGFRLIYDHVPLVTIFRYPVKAQLAMLFPVAILAACGVEMLAAMRRRIVIAAVALTIAAGIVGAAIASSESFTARLANAFDFTRVDSSLALGFAHAALAALAFAAASSRKWVVAAVVTLDLTIAGYRVNDYAPREIFDEPPAAPAVRDAAAGLRFYPAERPKVVRGKGDSIRTIAEWQISTLDDYAASTFGIPVVFHTDYDGLAPARISHLSGLMPSLPWERRRGLLDRAGVRAFFAPKPLAMPNLVEVARLDLPRAPLRLYLNRQAMPARFVSRVEVASDPIVRVIESGDLTTAIVEAPIPAGNCGAAMVRVVSRSLNTARYAVDAPCRGLVVFSENHYDGWHATVDGREVPHVRADYAFTAVAVEPGRHTIDRRYRPPRLLLGAVGSLLTALVVVGLGVRRGPAVLT